MTTRPPHQPLAHYVSIAEAAEHACVSDKSIRRYIAAGLLTGYRCGPRLIRIDIDELNAMLRPIPTATGGGDVERRPATKPQVTSRNTQQRHDGRCSQRLAMSHD